MGALDSVSLPGPVERNQQDSHWFYARANNAWIVCHIRQLLVPPYHRVIVHIQIPDNKPGSECDSNSLWLSRYRQGECGIFLDSAVLESLWITPVLGFKKFSYNYVIELFVNDTGNLTMEKKEFGYVDSDYLTAARDLFTPVKQRSYELMGEITQKHILDIGCGPGLDTVAMAELVGEKGRVEGVDYDPVMIKEAESLANAQHVNDRVMHHVASATHLPFADNHFDAVRSERLFMHLTEVDCALAEAARVTKPGGRVVVIDTDWGSLSTNTGADDIERCLVQFRAEKFLANGYSGRRLFGLFSAQSLEDIRVETVALHTTDLTLWQLLTQTSQVTDVAREREVLTEEEVQFWNNALMRSSEMGTFFGSVNVVMVSGKAV